MLKLSFFLSLILQQNENKIKLLVQIIKEFLLQTFKELPLTGRLHLLNPS